MSAEALARQLPELTAAEARRVVSAITRRGAAALAERRR
jgi:hypothetical protein